MSEHTVTEQTETTQAGMLARVEALEQELARLRAHAGRASGDTEGADLGMAPGNPGAAAEPTASRRDLLRYGAVVLGAAAAGLTARPAEAANGDPVLVGGTHTGTSRTTITLTTAGANNNAAIHGDSTAAAGSGDNFGLWGSSNFVGVVGNGNAGTGICAGGYFESVSNAGFGVIGNSTADDGVTAGVVGQCDSPNGSAVFGENFNGGNAVMGRLAGSANGITVYGLNASSYAGPGPGGGGFGAYGFSLKGPGLVGATGTAGGAAVAGSTNGIAGAYAGVFYGPVVVTGSFTVLGAKSAAVPHPDGSHRRLYCVESPESWFEDFGSGTLACGRAEVMIDPDFAALAEMEGYQVFLTGYDHDHVLHVTNRTPCGFTVLANLALAKLQGKQEEELSGTFGWRIVARRKDIEGERLATVTIPPAPQLPEVPPTIDLAPDWRKTIRTPTAR